MEQKKLLSWEQGNHYKKTGAYEILLRLEMATATASETGVKFVKQQLA